MEDTVKISKSHSAMRYFNLYYMLPLASVFRNDEDILSPQLQPFSVRNPLLEEACY